MGGVKYSLRSLFESHLREYLRKTPGDSDVRKFIVIDERGEPVNPVSLLNDPDILNSSLVFSSPGDVWFAADDAGDLYILDACGNYIHAPSRYRALFK